MAAVAALTFLEKSKGEDDEEDDEEEDELESWCALRCSSFKIALLASSKLLMARDSVG